MPSRDMSLCGHSTRSCGLSNCQCMSSSYDLCAASHIWSGCTFPRITMTCHCDMAAGDEAEEVRQVVGRGLQAIGAAGPISLWLPLSLEPALVLVATPEDRTVSLAALTDLVQGAGVG